MIFICGGVRPTFCVNIDVHVLLIYLGHCVLYCFLWMFELVASYFKLQNDFDPSKKICATSCLRLNLVVLLQI